MVRTTSILVLTFFAATCFSAAACSGSNDSPTDGASGSSTMTSAGTAATPTAGTSAAAGTGTGTAGTSATAGTGGAASAGTGPVGTAGTATAAGEFMPLCAGLGSAAGADPTKAGACTAADAQVCYKTCGPQSSGYKSETCTAGAYAEQSGCAFPLELDATCFKLPTAQDATCPATPPQASMACTVAPCTLCNGGGGPTGTYLDSKGASKAGYCVCPAPGASGTSKWSCASTDAWPCPGGKGC
jgi:hypothetical protein